MIISLCGLGKLGAPMTAAIASRGFEIIAYDALPGPVAELAAGRAPVPEPGLAELITAHRSRIHAVPHAREAVLRSDITFVIVPTPSEPSGGFSLRYALAAFTEIGVVLREKATFHHVVLCSTVLPGATRHQLIPALEQAAGKQCGRDFTVSYSPEFIALGSVLRDFLNPDFVLIGEYDTAGGDALEKFYGQLLAKPAPRRRMTLENAELAKISLNSYITMKISFANLLADYCEMVPGGDAEVVCQALGDDARIGRKYFSGGHAFGGPCFPRDNRALAAFAAQVGREAELPLATAAYNSALLQRSIDQVKALLPAGGVAAVLGLAYKPATPVIDESPGLLLAQALAQDGRQVQVHDPLAGETARRVLPAGVMYADTPTAALRGAAVAVIATPHPIYRNLQPADLPTTGDLVIIDYWRVLDPSLGAAPHVRLIQRGRSELPASSTITPLATAWRPA